MGRIAAGEDFGQAVTRPTRFNETATPRAAYGSGAGIERAGVQLENEGRRQEHAAAVERDQIMREQAHQRHEADKAMASAGIGVLRDRLGDITKEIDAEIQDGRLPKTEAGAAWKTRAQAAIDDGLETLPQSFRELARFDLQGRAQSLSSAVGDAVRRRDRSDTLAGMLQTIEHATRLPDPVAQRATLDQALTLAPAAGLQPHEVQALRQKTIEGMAYTRAFTLVEGAKLDNAALSKVEQAIVKDGELDPFTKAKLGAQIENHRASNEARVIRAAQRAEIEAAKRQRESDSAFGVLSDRFTAGVKTNEVADAALIAKLTPMHLAAYRSMATDFGPRTALAMQPLDAMQARLDALVAKRNTEGASQALDAEIKRTREVTTAAQTAYKNEPLRAGAERGVIDAVAPVNLTSFEAAASSLAQRVDQARAVSTITKAGVSPLTRDEASQFADLLTKIPPDVKAQRIAQLGAVLPPDQAQALAKQIDEKDKALGLQFAYGTARTTNGRLVSELIGKGAQAMKDGTSTKNDAQSARPAATWKPHAADALRDVFPKKAVADNLIEAATYIMHSIASEQQGRLTGDDMDRAIKLAIGGELVLHNRKMIPLPAGVTLYDLDKRLRSITPAEINAPGGMVRVGMVEVPVVPFVESLPGRQLLPVAPGVFTPLENGRPVVNHFGKPIEIGVR